MQKYLFRLQFKSEMITLLSISDKIIIIFTYTKVWKSNVNDDEDDEDILLPKLIERLLYFNITENCHDNNSV